MDDVMSTYPNEPYSIYLSHRPCRVAFFVPSDCSLEILDALIELNRTFWGGRFNPIVITDGDQVDDAWWEFLERYDADIIACLVELDESLVTLIHRRLAPLRIESIDCSEGRIRLEDELMEILPTQDNVNRVRGGFRDSPATLALFH